MLSFLEAPKGVLNTMNASRAMMVWQETRYKKKYHLVNWFVVCMPKSRGGLGILDLNIMNKCLLMKWLWKLENSEGLWQDLLFRKYLSNQTLTVVVAGNNESQFWQGLMKVKDTFVSLTRMVVHNGAKILFCKDVWLEEKKLAELFPRIFNIIFTKQVTVKFVKDSDGVVLVLENPYMENTWGNGRS